MLLPWLLWQIGPVRRVAPLAVVQILIGVVLGPSCLGRLAPELHATIFSRPVLGALDGIAGLGVLLYVFVTGLHLDMAIHHRVIRRLGGAALGSVLVPLLLGTAAGWWMLRAIPGALGPLGNAAAFIAAVAICIAVTALPVLAAVLGEMGLLRARIGQTALALAALNDAALWVMLAVLLALAGNAGSGGLLALGAAALWFGLLLFVVRPLLVHLAEAGDQALLVAGAALAILSAGVSEALGTGYLIGAFVAGAIIPPGCRPALLGRLELVTATVLLPFFFMSTGLKALIEPGSASFLGLLAAALAATVIGKLAGTALPARRLGFSWAESLSLGAMMQTKGLMEVVVLSVLRDAGLIGGQIFSAMVAMAVVCTVLTAPSVRLFQKLETGRNPQPPFAASPSCRAPIDSEQQGQPMMVRSSCHCGSVGLAIDALPAEVTDCNCSLCRRYGVLWAYYSPKQVHVVPADAATDTYLWGERKIRFHRCRDCGCVLFWSAVDPAHDRMGVNARLLPPEVLARARTRHLDGAYTEEYIN